MTSRTAPAVLVQAVASQNGGTVMLARETPTSLLVGAVLRGWSTLPGCCLFDVKRSVNHCPPWCSLDFLGRTGTAMDDLLNDFSGRNGRDTAEAGGALVAELIRRPRNRRDFPSGPSIKGSSGFSRAAARDRAGARRRRRARPGSPRAAPPMRRW